MFQKRAVMLLSAQWRPHSEQLKLWIIGSASDVTTLSLARDYVNNLDVGSVLQTFEDGLELTGILPVIKYPLGTHTFSKLSAHFEASAGELSASELHQLASSISLSPENLDYYDATLSTPGVIAAIRCCLQRADNSELIAFARPFWQRCEQALQVSTGLASLVTQITADELAFRLSTSSDKATFFDITLMEGLPLEQKGMEGLVKHLQSATEELEKADLLDLLERIAAPRNSQRYATWGMAVQKALIEKGGVTDANCFEVFVKLMLTGTIIDDSICRQICKASVCIGSERTLEVLNAWRDSNSTTCSGSTSLEDVQAALQRHIRVQLEQSQPETSTVEYLEWVLCLSFFSQTDASSLLSRAVTSGRLSGELSAKETAVVCDVMISTCVIPHSLLSAIRRSVESNELSQRASVHALYILQRSGIKASPTLIKRAIGRAGARLVAACTLKKSVDDELFPRDRALLVAGLCFVDDEQQPVLLRRIVESQEVSLSAAMCFLRHAGQATTNSSRWVRKTALSRVLRSASSCSAEELSLVLSALSDLGVRDATAFQRVLEELKRKAPRTEDVVVAAKAARNLRLTSLLEQSELIESLSHIASVSSDDLLVLLSCCTAKQRQALLLFPDVTAALNQISLADSTTSDLVLLFTFLSSQDGKRAEVVAELQTREPVERGALSADDVLAAFESVDSSQEVENLGRVLIRAVQNCGESHLMRLLRCASRYSKVPKTFFRLAGKPIISAANEKRLSPVNASAWLNFYVNNQIRDDSVGRSLLSLLSRAQSRSPSPFYQDYCRGARFYGVNVKKTSRRKQLSDFSLLSPQ
ncbi:hypothetical protein LPMP_200740 [Leishmania panamensis]|uniref:Uncharacterized protein n=1 Tax=Leishmania panamensis TaxID=5679 RepID=A0A088S7K0_LEIPA|nr:hypothetical protein LPMP_200740 [Leishmania panamensis]AIN97566.1 hypothetical protein LPMP_200740 [Leishmania panamensis]